MDLEKLNLRKRVLKSRLKDDESFGQTKSQLKTYFEEDKESGNIPQNMSWSHFLKQHKQLMREQIKEELKEIEVEKNE